MKNNYLKSFAEKTKNRFINLPIYKKLLLIIGILTFTMSCFSLIAIEVTSHSNQKLLYSSISSLMGSSSTEISDQLTDTVELTQSMLSNMNLQNMLVELKETKDEAENLSPYTNLYQELSTLVYDYYYTYPSRNISYIAVTNGSFTLSTYNKGNRLNPGIMEDIMLQAEEAQGAPVLITDYAQEYGIFLGRTVRRIDSLQLDSLGTIIVNLDIQSLLQDATENIVLSEDAAYILSEVDSTDPFYISEDLSLDDFHFPGSENYAVCSIDGKEYFTVRGQISGYDWNYLCLIEYNSILSSLSTTKILCIVMILCAALFFFLLARKFVRSLTRHLNLLTEKMIAFGKDDSVLPQNKYDYTLRKDEIGTLHNQFDTMARKIQTLINENYKNELLRKDMMLKNLQNQINPHFLYNTLESINWRAKASGEKEISQMVEALGSLLRTSLSPHPDISTLKDELQIVRNYITIQKIRFEDRLHYSENIDPAVLDCEIPLLTIQPLVENAIRYSLEVNIDACSIMVNVFSTERKITIQVINDGSQFEDDTLEKLISHQMIPHGFGIGILNIQKGIHMIYGNQYGIELKNVDEEHALSEIVLPVTKTQKGERHD